MFIALSTFTISNNMAPQVKEAFINRPHQVDEAVGFIKLEVLSPQENPDEIWLMTYWETEENYKAWYKSHQYHEAHNGIPAGLKLIPNSAKVRFFNLVSQ